MSNSLREYRNKIRELTQQFEEGKYAASVTYAFANSPINIGDIITDHVGNIMVENMTIYRSDPPTCIYRGLAYTKANKPFKNNEIRQVWQENLKKINGADYKYEKPKE